MDPNYDLWDKLVDVSAAGSAAKKMPSPPTSSGQSKTDALISGSPMETEINIPDAIPNPLPQDVISQNSVDITHNKKWGTMHNERLALLVESAPSAKNRLPSHGISNDLTPDARLDIAVKEWAFSSNFRLSLKPPLTFDARITTIQGEVIATGYNRVVADGESIWLEVPRSNMNLGKFKARQRTASRHFWTCSGVTAHKQIEPELGLSPRQHKLAVKVKRNLPSCRLIAGKWYIHAHQVRIETQVNGRWVSRRLKTNHLISLLRSIFGRAYHPRSNTSPSLQRHQRKSPRTELRTDNAEAQPKAAPTTYIPTSTLANNFPVPLHATQPWPNPAYLAGQLSYLPATSTVLPSPQAAMQPQQMKQWTGQQVLMPGTFAEQRAPPIQN